MANLLTLVTFDDTIGSDPEGGLTLGPDGALIGTTQASPGPTSGGEVYELSFNGGAYSATPTILATFPSSGVDGEDPYASIIIEPDGDIFGETYQGGANDDGVVYEVYNFGTSYDSTPDPVFSSDDSYGYLRGGLLTNAKGDFFGVASGGFDGGVVFELTNSRFGLSGTPTVLATFAGGDSVTGPLLEDAKGDLIGTTLGYSGNSGDRYGTVFEIAKTSSGYASTPTTLASFVYDVDGEEPSGLIMDGAGDLFGITPAGYGNEGSVFEIAKVDGVYASSPTTLATFNGGDGAGPSGSLIMDAKGDLFGTAEEGGANGDGDVFEIVRTSSGYSSTPLVLVNFDYDAETGTGGYYPATGVVANAEGDLLGTTTGNSEIFEVTDSGFVITSSVDFSADGTSDLLWYNSTSGKFEDWLIQNGAESEANTIKTLSPTSGWTYEGTGDFNGDGEADLLFETAAGKVMTWLISGGAYAGKATIGTLPSGFTVVGTGDFNGEGTSDILLEDSATGVVQDWIVGADKKEATNTLGTLASGWSVLGTGDFTGNGVDGVLIQDSSTGALADWTLVNGQKSGSIAITDDGLNVGSGWTYVGNGDFTGDGTSDLLFENSSGALMSWDLSEGAYASSQSLGASVPTGYSVIGTGDYTGNGVYDVLIHDASTGEAEIGPVSGGQISAWTAVGTLAAGSGWKLLA